MRAKRPSLLLLSIALSTVVYSLLLALAPYISILQTYRVPRPVRELIQVRLREEAPAKSAEAAPQSSLLTRPTSLRSVLERTEDAPPTAAPPPKREWLPPSVLTAPPAPESLPLAASETADPTEILKKADARIIEIAQDDARRDLKVARRLVHPSSTRLLEEGEYPALRSVAAEPGGQALGRPAGVRAGQTTDTPPSPFSDIEPPVHAEGLDVEIPVVRGEQKLLEEPIQRSAEETKAERPYEFWDDLLDIQMAVYTPADEPYVYFQLMLGIKKDAQVSPLPQQLFFVVDASASIMQSKLDRTLAGLRRLLPQLREADRFTIVLFRDTPAFFQPTPVNATEPNKKAAEKFITNVTSGGQTDIYQALTQVIQQTRETGTPSAVWLFSDGRPTTGIQDSRTIINRLTEENARRHVLFTVGVGSTVNRYLLDLLAYRNQGKNHLIQNMEDCPRDIPQAFMPYRECLLTQLQADYSGIGNTEIYPRELPDLYRNVPVAVYGRAPQKELRDFALRLSGWAGSKKKEVVFRSRIQDATQGNKDIARNWAFHKAYSVIAEIARRGENPSLFDELKQLREKFGVRTIYSE